MVFPSFTSTPSQATVKNLTRVEVQGDVNQANPQKIEAVWTALLTGKPSQFRAAAKKYCDPPAGDGPLVSGSMFGLARIVAEAPPRLTIANDHDGACRDWLVVGDHGAQVDRMIRRDAQIARATSAQSATVKTPVSIDGNKPPIKRPSAVTVDFGLQNASYRIIEEALGVAAGEKVIVIVDLVREMAGESFVAVTRARGATANVFVLEKLGTRPIVTVPEPLRVALEQAQASIFLGGTDLEPETAFRRELLEIVERVGLRHAHLIGLDRRSLIAGFTVPFSRVAEQTRAVRVRLRPDSRFHLRSASGSDLEVVTSAKYRWGDQSGIIRSGKWSNLPAGQLYTTPESVNGTFVADASVGGAFSTRGLLKKTPIVFTIKDGVCCGVSCTDSALARDVERHLESLPDLNRVGQVVIGTNPSLSSIGEFGFDHCAPGLHLTFGWSHPKVTGAEWVSAGSFVGNTAEGNVDLDNVSIVRQGRYVI